MTPWPKNGPAKNGPVGAALPALNNINFDNKSLVLSIIAFSFFESIHDRIIKQNNSNLRLNGRVEQEKNHI